MGTPIALFVVQRARSVEELMMQRCLHGSVTFAVDGEVRNIDPVNREITLRVQGESVTLDVPTDCTILLRGEPVKLRLIQPRDRLHVKAERIQDRCIARMVEVLPLGMKL